MANIFGILAIGFFTGAMARLAVPGPDPMPVWLTLAIGLVGSFVGGVIALAIFGRDDTAIPIGGFIASILLVVAYRRFVQKRPAFGPEALKFPERGFGVDDARERLQALGLPLDQTAPAVSRPTSPDIDDLLVKLNELHRADVLTDEEYRAKRELVLSRDEKPQP
jgi:uncharacterized membrane protein YeaQ/YmgE (transglycosylase-associated protein family)